MDRPAFQPRLMHPCLKDLSLVTTNEVDAGCPQVVESSMPCCSVNTAIADLIFEHMTNFGRGTQMPRLEHRICIIRRAPESFAFPVDRSLSSTLTPCPVNSLQLGFDAEQFHMLCDSITLYT